MSEADTGAGRRGPWPRPLAKDAPPNLVKCPRWGTFYGESAPGRTHSAVKVAQLEHISRRKCPRWGTFCGEIAPGGAHFTDFEVKVPRVGQISRRNSLRCPMTQMSYALFAPTFILAPPPGNSCIRPCMLYLSLCKGYFMPINEILTQCLPSRRARVGTAQAQHGPTHVDRVLDSSSFGCGRCTVTAQANPCQTHVGPCQIHTVLMGSVSRGYSVGVTRALHGFCMEWPTQLLYRARVQNRLKTTFQTETIRSSSVPLHGVQPMIKLRRPCTDKKCSFLQKCSNSNVTRHQSLCPMGGQIKDFSK